MQNEKEERPMRNEMAELLDGFLKYNDGEFTDDLPWGAIKLEGDFVSASTKLIFEIVRILSYEILPQIEEYDNEDQVKTLLKKGRRSEDAEEAFEAYKEFVCDAARSAKKINDKLTAMNESFRDEIVLELNALETACDFAAGYEQ